jgi:hypothetical protein
MAHVPVDNGERYFWRKIFLPVEKTVRKIWCPFLLMGNVEKPECMLEECGIYNRYFRICGMAFIRRNRDWDATIETRDIGKEKTLYNGLREKGVRP